jgi:Bifunctional DNA primase/polymerase, N-terminal/Primase C terminal 2 (PriCT-2)
VFPCLPRDKDPLGTLVPHGFKDATDNKFLIRRWWTERPDANIGLPTGHENGIIVVDPDGEEGERLLALAEKKYGKLPPTFESKTGNGRHIFFALPEGCGRVPSKNSSRPKGQPDKHEGLDLKADGGYVIAPPSVHPNGKTYAWGETEMNECAPAPPWLLEAAKEWLGFLKALEAPAAAEGGSVAPTGGPQVKGRPGASLSHPEAFPVRQPDIVPWSEGEDERLRAALAVFSTHDRDDRGIWFAVGAGLHKLETADPRWRGREKWDEWSKTSTKFDGAGQGQDLGIVRPGL